MALPAAAMYVGAKAAVPWIGSAISAGASLLGGLFSSRSAGRANESNAALQREFAQNQIQWRVADAKAAGIHPLAALGASTTGAAPSYVGEDPASGLSRAGSQVGQAITQRGQNSANIQHTAASTDLIRQQILASRQAMALQRANFQQDFQRDKILLEPPRDQAEGNPTIAGGFKVKTGESMSAEEAENRYGEIGEQFQGLINLGADIVQNVPTKVFDAWLSNRIRGKDRRAALERKMRAAAKTGKRPGAYGSMFKNRQYYDRN